MTIAIVACGQSKTDYPAPARELYTSSTFRLNLAAAEAIAGRVLVLSARHGLVELDQVLDPYDTTWGDDGETDVLTLALQLHPLCDPDRSAQDIYLLGPRVYADHLDMAARLLGTTVTWVNEADAGIGYQRGTAAAIARHG